MVGGMFGNTNMDQLASRLGSFREWPNTGSVKPKDLAEAGFYYIGQGDSVRCFSCGGTKDRWKFGDIPLEVHYRLFGSCKFLQDLDKDVVAYPPVSKPLLKEFDIIECDMENEEERLLSFNRNAGWSGTVDPRKLAAAGFYYTGIRDHVKCFACDLSLKAWQPDDDPVTEHLNHKSNCSFISKFNKKFSVTVRPNMSQETNHGPPLGNTLYEASNPYHQPLVIPSGHVPTTKRNYAGEHARLRTFINWPKSCPVQPKELIDAGFFYTGSRDKVQCFTCGIILAGWEPHDTPWGEHMKWSKSCPLVIEYLQQRNPHTPSSSPLVQNQPQEQNEPFWPLSTHQSGKFDTESLKHSNVVSLPKVEEHLKTKQKIEPQEEDEIFYLEKAAQRLVDDGFYDYSTIQEAVKQRVKVEEMHIRNMNELLNAIECYQNKKQDMNTKTKEQEIDLVEIPAVNPSSHLKLTFNQADVNRHAQKLEDAHRCKICLDAEIGIVFLPCGHLVCCPKCAQEIQARTNPTCPICRKCIDTTIRSYLT